MKKRRKLILLPKRYEPYGNIQDSYYVLFKLMMKKLDFDIWFTNSAYDLPDDTSVLVVYNSPACANPMTISWLSNLLGNIKLIAIYDDMHGTPAMEKYQKMVFARASKILVASKTYFVDHWPEFSDKAVFFPNWFYHERCMGLEIKSTPKMKALLTGIMTHGIYPIRIWLRRQTQRNEKYQHLIDVQKHPGWPPKKGADYVTRDAYARLLNEYFCCIATPGCRPDYTVCKYFEIPAAGSLLLATETKELHSLGFIPGKNYVPFVKEDIFATIKDMQNNKGKYDKIRLAGTKMVRENHSEINRFEQIKTILEEIA